MCRTKAPATAASKALPPRSSTDCAVDDASQWVDAAIPNDPFRSGRVVVVLAGFQLMLRAYALGGCSRKTKEACELSRGIRAAPAAR
ncbi:MAG: hypothetical protein JWP75_2355 [Frondihabitans sp.]|nr:hypothetical protein [Frondihabitans sp.]